MLKYYCRLIYQHSGDERIYCTAICLGNVSFRWVERVKLGQQQIQVLQLLDSTSIAAIAATMSIISTVSTASTNRKSHIFSVCIPICVCIIIVEPKFFLLLP